MRLALGLQRTNRLCVSIVKKTRGLCLVRALLIPKARTMLGPASQPWPENPGELVHDTRVASRRFVEALDLVKPALSASAYKKLRTSAQNLRRTLGTGREAEVMWGNFQALAQRENLEKTSVKSIENRLSESIKNALTFAQTRYPPSKCQKIYKTIDKNLRDIHSRWSFSILMGPHLFSRTESAENLLIYLNDPTQAKAHHDLRIELKKLRYSSEIINQVMGDDVPEPLPIPALKSMQEALGNLQDAHDLADFLREKPIRALVGVRQLKQCWKAADYHVDTTYQHARNIIRSMFPEVFGILRRTAGKIGPLETIPTR